MATYRAGTVTVWLKIRQEYPMSSPTLLWVLEKEPINTTCQDNERIVKVDVAIPENFCKPIEYVTTVEAELTTPVMLVPDDKHSAFRE